jgi:mannose/fructose/N-acetylgalactosamine-specific phosphotransferase system component IIC
MLPVFDAHTMEQILLAALAGGVIGLDRTAWGQFMVSQPIVAGPAVGWLLGDASAGLAIGGALELVWVLDIPVGTFVPADATVSAVVATAIAAITGQGAADASVIGFSLLLTTVMVPVTMIADHLMRMRNAQIPELAEGKAGTPSEALVTGWHLAGLIAFFLKSFVLCFCMIPAGLALMALFLSLPPALHWSMVLFTASLPLLGAALILRKQSMEVLDRFLLTGFALAVVCVHVLQIPVLAAVPLAAGAGWLGVRLGRS